MEDNSYISDNQDSEIDSDEENVLLEYLREENQTEETISNESESNYEEDVISQEQFEEKKETLLTVTEPLDEIEVDILKETYQMLTSKVYTNQDPSEMITELMELKSFLQYEAKRYRLYAECYTIHTTIFLEDLDEVTFDDMHAYVQLMHYEIPEHILEGGIHMELAHYLYIQLRRRLENFRHYTYIAKLFFDDFSTFENDRAVLFENVPKFDTQPSPNPYTIQKRGVNYYFFRLGELTVESLIMRYDFRELYQMLMMFRRMLWNSNDERVRDQHEHDMTWFLTNLTQTEDVARALIASIADLKLDPRMYLVLDGPQSAILVEKDEPIYSLADNKLIDYDELVLACQYDGIPSLIANNQDLKPAPVLLTEYTISQLSSSFYGHQGKHRILLEAVINEKFSDGVEVLDKLQEELVFYGKRDGFSHMIVYHIDELYQIFKEVQDFYDPHSILRNPTQPHLWVKFPRRTILRLIQVILPNKNNINEIRLKSLRLISLCQQLLGDNNETVGKPTEPLLSANTNISSFDNELEKQQLRLCLDKIQSSDEESKLMLKKVLFRMYNVGFQFVEWDEKIDRYDQDLVSFMALKDPSFVPEESSATGRIRAETRNLILHLQDSISMLGDNKQYFELLRIVRTTSSTKLNDEEFDQKSSIEGLSYITSFDSLYLNSDQYQNNFYLTYDDDMYTIGYFLDVMHEMAKFNLSNGLKMSGFWLMVTANVYSKLLVGTSINSLQLDITYE